jgi:hypothetical protein
MHPAHAARTLHEDVAVCEQLERLQGAAAGPDQPLAPLDKLLLVAQQAADLYDVALHVVLQDLERLRVRVVLAGVCVCVCVVECVVLKVVRGVPGRACRGRERTRQCQQTRAPAHPNTGAHTTAPTCGAGTLRASSLMRSRALMMM